MHAACACRGIQWLFAALKLRTRYRGFYCGRLIVMQTEQLWFTYSTDRMYQGSDKSSSEG
jgi:hypothetical protein